MNTSTKPFKKNWLLPSSSEELEQFVKRTLGGAIGLIEEERAAVYSRVSVIDPNARSYSMEYQPDRSEEYARCQRLAHHRHSTKILTAPDATAAGQACRR